MGSLVRYQSLMADSSRWERFEHRPGDVVICTPPKSGTTWTQMLCALMVFDGPDLPDRLDALSPWLDMFIRSEDEVLAVYAEQEHRRFIKTHTPLDGLPMRDDVHYVVVGRDPRDVSVSMEHHMANLDLSVVVANRLAAVGADGLADREPPAEPDPDPAVRFREFVEESWSPVSTGTALAHVVHHLRTGWERRHEPNVGLFHFLDYQRDLVGEMVRLAELCGFDHSRERLAELAPEAGIARMRDRAEEVAPDLGASEHWRDPARFFRSGGTGEWRDRADADALRRYDERVTELTADPELARWIHEGARGRT